MAARPLALVTGGGRGMGANISRAFHAAGYRVAILSRQDEGLAASLGEQALYVPADVTRPADVDAAVRRAAQWGGAVSALVNNAGMSGWRPLADIDDEFWAAMIGVNLSGVLFTARAALPHLAPDAAIVNVSSLAGKRGSANNAAYCAAKFGVNGLTQSLAKELGPRGVRVNAVCPVYVDTAGLREALADPAAPPKGRSTDEYLEEFGRTQAALGRLPRGEEVAAVCVMLASPSASAITGQCINVDCGVLPQ
jgi:NAD(P)-dependent dehydrogenase (short-subunit alcohol dehydrogenase family)